MAESHYRLRRAKGKKPRYDLHSHEMAVASLTMRDPRPNSGILSVSGEEWFVEQGARWEGRIQIKRRAAPDEIATFNHDLRYRGSISLNGRTYHWAPANRRWTIWRWTNEEGVEVMRLRIKPHLWRTEGEIVSQHHLTPSESHHLSLLGWFLILSYLQNVEFMGLLGALKLVSKARKRA
jgi:hypothetical protein